ITVTPGERLAIVLRSDADAITAGHGYEWELGFTNLYPAGDSFFRTPGNPWSLNSLPASQGFEEFLSVPEPSPVVSLVSGVLCRLAGMGGAAVGLLLEAIRRAGAQRRVRFSCPACSRPLAVERTRAGKNAACPYCQAIVFVPDVVQAEAAGWERTPDQRRNTV